MKPAAVRLLGVITLLFDAGNVMLLVSRGTPSTTSALTRYVVFVVTTTLVALGLFLLCKWAAVLFAVATGASAVWLIVGTVGGVPFPWSLINFGFVVLLLALAAVVIWSWPSLSWRGKWLR